MTDRRDARLYIAAASLSTFAAGVAFLYLNFYFRALGLGDAVIGGLNAAPAVGLALAALPTFALADRFPRKRVILAGGALTLAATLGVIASSEPAALFAFATFFGAGEVVANAAGLALLAEATEGEGRTRTFGVSFAVSLLAAFIANVVGGAGAAPLGSLLAAPPSDVRVLRALLLSAAVVGACSGVPILMLRSRERPPRVAAPRQWRVLGRFLLVGGLFGFGAGNFLPFLNLFFAERFGLDFALVGLVIGAVNVGGAVGALLHTRFASRLGTVRAMVAAWSASLPLALLGAVAPTAPLAAAALIARGVLMTAAVPTLDAFTLSSFRPQERSGAQAAVSTTWALAYGLGAIVSGNVRAVLGEVGFSVNLLTLAASYAFAIGVFVTFFRGHVPLRDREDESGTLTAASRRPS